MVTCRTRAMKLHTEMLEMTLTGCRRPGRFQGSRRDGLVVFWEIGKLIPGAFNDAGGERHAWLVHSKIYDLNMGQGYEAR